MKNVKFWLVQIALVAIVSMIFGSPAFAGPTGDPSNGARNGGQKHNDHNSNGVSHSAERAKGFTVAVAKSSDEQVPECAVEEMIAEGSWTADGYVEIMVCP